MHRLLTIGYVVDSSRKVPEPFIREEILALQRRGHTIVLIPLRQPFSEEPLVPDGLTGVQTLTEQPSLLSLFMGALLTLLTLPVRVVAGWPTARRMVGWRLLPWLLWASRQIHRYRMDRLHAHFIGAASVRAMALAHLADIPFSCTGHGSDLLLKRHIQIPDLVARARPFITVSQYNRRTVIDEYHLTNASIEVVHCGVDLTKFHPRVRPLRTPPLLLSVTWLIEVKGVVYLLDACQRLKKMGCSFRCLIVGGGRDEQDFVNAQQDVELRQINDVVTLIRRVPHSEICAHMQRADVFVLPSLSEGLPVSLMEAMAMELPVVATRITGIPELVDDGLNGFLVEPRDAEALSDRMKLLLDNPDLRQRLGKAGRSKIVREFDIDSEARRLEQLWLNITLPPPG